MVSYEYWEILGFELGVKFPPDAIIFMCVAPKFNWLSITLKISLELCAIDPKNQQWPSFIVIGVPVGKIFGPLFIPSSISFFKGKIKLFGDPKSLIEVTPDKSDFSAFFIALSYLWSSSSLK